MIARQRTPASAKAAAARRSSTRAEPDALARAVRSGQDEAAYRIIDGMLGLNPESPRKP